MTRKPRALDSLSLHLRAVPILQQPFHTFPTCPTPCSDSHIDALCPNSADKARCSGLEGFRVVPKRNYSAVKASGKNSVRNTPPAFDESEQQAMPPDIPSQGDARHATENGLYGYSNRNVESEGELQSPDLSVSFISVAAYEFIVDLV
jgi:hypothetical protein